MITINAEARDVKVNPKMIRKQGKIPAVFYGGGQVSTAISVGRAEFTKALKDAGESSIISLKTPKGALDALIHDVALDPVMGDPIHVDFYITSKDHKLEVDVPLEYIGVAPAEKLGGVVVKIMHEMRIESLPATLPHQITVDLAVLTELNSHLLVKDLALPTGVKALVPATEVIAMVSQPQIEKEEVAPAPDLSAIEVEKKGKKDDAEGSEEGDATDKK